MKRQEMTSNWPCKVTNAVTKFAPGRYEGNCRHLEIKCLHWDVFLSGYPGDEANHNIS